MPSTPKAGISIPLGDISGRGKEGRQGGKAEVLLHLPPPPTNSTLESSPNMLVSVSSTDSDPPPLPMKK